MQNIKLFLILKSLTPAELKELGKFISSPYHNSNKTLLKFFNFLKSKYPEFASRTLELEYMYKKLFPSKVYNAGVMRNLISDMIKITEVFLAIQNFKINSDIYYINLLEQLKLRDIEKLFEKTYNEAQEHIDKTIVKDEDYYYNRYLLASIKRDFYQNKLHVGKRDEINKKLPGEIENLKYAFFIKLMKEFFLIYNVMMQNKIKFRYKFLEEIMSHISKEDEYKEIPLLYIHYIFLSILIEGKNEHLLPEIKNMIDKHGDILPHTDLRNFYIELLNYYRDKAVEGDKEAGKISFELNKEMLDRNIYLRPGELMTAHSYVNTCVNALRIGEIKWAEDFTNKYKCMLLQNHQQNAYLYNFALIFYKKGGEAVNKKEKETNLRKSLEYLSRVKSEDFFYMTRIKNMQILTMYQLGELETALNIIHNYKQYLSKNKSIPENLYERYLNFANFAHLLIKASLNSDYESIMQLKNQLNATPKTEFKKWLLKNICELEVKFKSTKKSKKSLH